MEIFVIWLFSPVVQELFLSVFQCFSNIIGSEWGGCETVTSKGKQGHSRTNVTEGGKNSQILVTGTRLYTDQSVLLQS